MRWHKPLEKLPLEGQIVIVHGGIAQFRAGRFWTGMECPQFTRVIQWEVEWWTALPYPPGVGREGALRANSGR